MNDDERAELERLRAENARLRRVADADDPATPRQLALLQHLTCGDALHRLSKREAGRLIAFLKAAPDNMTRSQQLYLYGLIDKLPRELVGELINKLAALDAPPSEPRRLRDRGGEAPPANGWARRRAGLLRDVSAEVDGDAP